MQGKPSVINSSLASNLPSGNDLQIEESITTAMLAVHQARLLPYWVTADENNELALLEFGAATAYANQRRQQTFNNLAQGLTESNSNFTCPKALPYALSYTLQSDKLQYSFTLQIYRNACYNTPPGSGNANNDLLYGANQNIDSWGTASTLSAFIPISAPEGCHQSGNTLSISYNAPVVQVTPIYAQASTLTQVSGYKVNSTLQIDCTRLCNSLINKACASDFSYCGQKISNSFRVNSLYLLKNIKQHFCTCEISSGTYTFTQAIDIESLVKFNNPLQSVTCSNYAS